MAKIAIALALLSSKSPLLLQNSDLIGEDTAACHITLPCPDIVVLLRLRQSSSVIRRH